LVRESSRRIEGLTGVRLIISDACRGAKSGKLPRVGLFRGNMIDDGLHEAWANLCFFSESFAKLKSGGIYIIEDITPGDTEEMQRFATAISSKAKGAVVQALPHARNNVDNRLVVIQKA
jgi:hypothetical protein